MKLHKRTIEKIVKEAQDGDHLTELLETIDLFYDPDDHSHSTLIDSSNLNWSKVYSKDRG